MKKPTLTILFALLGAVLGSAQKAAPGNADNLATVELLPRVEIVEQAFAFAPGDVTIKGQNLWMVDWVRVDGVSVPFVKTGHGSLDLPLGPQYPGFFDLQLGHVGGILDETIEFLPSLRSEVFADRMELTFNGGGSLLEPGAFVLRWSLMPQAPVSHPNVYYFDMLDPRSGGVAVRGTSHGHPVTFAFPTRSIFWSPVYFQALHVASSCWSYSNHVRVDLD